MPGFPKSARIAQSRDFDHLLKAGQRLWRGAFGLCWQEGNKRRLGITVSRKIRGIAQKNRIKRVVREFFRCQPEAFPLGDVIVIAKEGADGLTREAIRQGLKTLLEGKR